MNTSGRYAAWALGGWLLIGTGARAADDEAIKRAVAAGVASLKSSQQANGTWSFKSHDLGATSLGGLTLLECDLPADDPAVKHAADCVRHAVAGNYNLEGIDQTYDLALAVIFLERLGSAKDVRLIESLTVRLLGGQNATGGWDYGCPTIQGNELARLKEVVLRTDDQPRKKMTKKPDLKDLPPQILAQLQQIELAQPFGRAGQTGDNSNTQFATLGLWVGRRDGLPVDKALSRIEQRYRQTQNPDGGWGYHISEPPSTAPMTCAGLLGLAVAYGAAFDIEEQCAEKGLPPPKHPAKDPGKDPAIRAGLIALSTAVGGTFGVQQPETGLNLNPTANGRLDNLMNKKDGNRLNYYFLWSLERVAMAYDLARLGNKDWYGWGAGLIVANQRADGGWAGEYAGPVDTCFALLFLRRSNLARDLTTSLRSRVRDPLDISLKSRGRVNTPPEKKMAGPGKTDKSTGLPELKLPDPALAALPPSLSPDTEAGRLGLELINASDDTQAAVLRKLRDSKGPAYTEALALAIPHLSGKFKIETRDALASRLTRMTAATLRDKLKDQDPEVRRAAALAAAANEDKTFIPDLVPLVADPVPLVARAAPVALQKLTGQDFGPAADAPPAEAEKAQSRWLEWWTKNQPK